MEGPREFHDRLREELPAWLADGLLTPGAARALAARYELDRARGATVRDRTGPVAAVGALALAGAFALAFRHHGLRDGSLLPLAALAACFAAAPLVLRGEGVAAVAAAIRGVGRGLFYAVAFALSFLPVAEALRIGAGGAPALAAAMPCLLLALGAAAVGLRRGDVDAHARGEAMLLSAAAVAFAAGLFLESGKGAAVVANLALAFLAAGRIVRGVSWRARAPFFEGLAVAALLAGSRVAEVGAEGWPRVTGPFLVGVGAVAAAVLFERRRARAAHHAAEQAFPA